MKKKVLVIDDSDTNNFLVKTILEENNDVLVFTLSDSRKALKVIDQVKPDLLLLDIMMPDIDGLQILRELKQLHKIDKIPTIIVSAKNSPGIKEEAFALGAIDFVSKPIGNNNLFSKVAKLLNNQQ